MQTVTYKLGTGVAGKTPTNISWVPMTKTLNTVVDVVIDFIYIGPEAKVPKLVYYKAYNSSTGAWENTGIGSEFIEYGGRGSSINHGKANSTDSNGNTKVWGWKEYVSGIETGRFYMDPSEAVITSGVEFRLTQVTLPTNEIKSSKTLSTGSDIEDDQFVVNLDATNTSILTEADYAKPQDILLVMDRSATMSTEASVVATIGRNANTTTINNAVNKMDKTKYAGYYRGMCWNRGHDSGTYYEKNAYTMPIRYNHNKEQWEMQVLPASCDCNSTSNQRPYGVYLWKSMKPCTHLQWVTIHEAYELYEDNRERETIVSGQDFKIIVPRFSKAIDGAVDFINGLLESSKT